MWKNKWSFEDAFNLVKSKRQCIDLNIGFCSQLNKWNKLLNLNKKDKIYHIDDKSNVHILNKNELHSNEITNDSIILFFKNDKVYKITTVINSKDSNNKESRSSNSGTISSNSSNGNTQSDKHDVIVEIVKKYEDCKEVCDFSDIDIENLKDLNTSKLENMMSLICF